MKKVRPFVILLVILSFFAAVFADVPPEPGQKRVVLSIIIDPADEFDGYRFFLKNGRDIKEFILRKSEKVTISSMGGGALYRNGKFLAVPKKSLEGLSEAPTANRLNALQQAVFDGTAADTIELVDHSFVRDVPAAAASGWKDPVYRIEKDAEKGIKAVWVSGGQYESKISGTLDPYYSTEPRTPSFWATVAGGSLLTLALICFGVYALRRSKVSGAQTLAK